jgi:alpha-tubulin suppressor-like RCC1 family protein
VASIASPTGDDALTAFLDESGRTVASVDTSHLPRAQQIALDGHGHLLLLTPDGDLVWRSSLDADQQHHLDDPPGDILSLCPGSSFFLVRTPRALYVLGSDNRFGQLGHADHRTSSSPGALREMDLFAGMSLPSLGAGDLHAAAVDAESGALYIWGSDAQGQCAGYGGGEPELVEWADAELDVRLVACGATHTVVATSNGVYVAGSSASCGASRRRG